MAKKITMVKCRYPKCFKLHDTTEIPKDEAFVAGPGRYYHHDCYHTMQMINQIRDIFIRDINPLMTDKQIGGLVSTINYIVFDKYVDVDFLKFALEYTIKYRPGYLKHPPGLHYIVQNRDVITAWDKEIAKKIRQELRQKSEGTPAMNLDLSNDFEYKPSKQRSFVDILN